MRVIITCELKSLRSAVGGSRMEAWDIDSERFSPEPLREIVTAIEDLGNEVYVAHTNDDLLTMRQSVGGDLCVNLSVGSGGPGGKANTAAILSALGIEFVGSEAFALAVGRDKAATKAIVASRGVLTPAWMLADAGDSRAVETWTAFPAIVKPIHESCSIGIDSQSVVCSGRDLAREVDRIRDVYRQTAIVEVYIDGVDLEVPLLGFPELEPLGCVAVLPAVSSDKHRILTSRAVYRDAYVFRRPEEIVPWTRDQDRATTDTALKVAQALQFRDYGRCDFRLDPDGRAWFIEVATQPYVARRSSFAFLQQGPAGYRGLWQRLLACGVSRIQRRKEAPLADLR